MSSCHIDKQELPHHDIPAVIPETSQQQKGDLSQTQKLQITQLPRNFRDVLKDDADYFKQLDDQNMDFKGCEVYVDERSGEVTVRFRGEVKAVVKENGLYAPDTGEILQYGFFEFEDDEELGLQSTCILAEATELKQTQLQSLIQSLPQNVTFWSQKYPNKVIEPLNNMISAKRKRDGSVLILEAAVLKFNSLQDQKVAQDLVSSLYGVLKKGASKVDTLINTLEPFARQKLFDKISREGANDIFPMPEVGPLLPEEQAGYARRALESSAAVVQGIAGLIHKVAQGDTYNLVGKMFKVFQASVVSLSDAQVERELRLEDVYQGPQTKDVLFQKSKERFKRKSAKQVIDGRRGFNNILEDQPFSLKAERVSAGKTKYSSKKEALIENSNLRTSKIQIIMIKFKKIYTIFTPNQYHFMAKSNPSSMLNRTYLYAHQNSTQQQISSKSGEQIEAVCWEHNCFDLAEELNKAVCWEHVSFDSEKNVERARCGIWDPPILQAGCEDQGSTDLAISQDGLAECGDQGSTDSADQLECNQYQQKKYRDKRKQDETESLKHQNTSRIATRYGTTYSRVFILSRSRLANRLRNYIKNK
ncbi:MAG: hypothetical protein EZS28_012941 [Streblomastix strix]|uniref:Uncharacterized protein n=1 Tax=Streblomastix strix TaxID=222440 RepID=A0A5J4W9B2_9EUKA|nr:MAG: hypothetical protein EZS28_012941 [Streblomastix strix]